MTEAPSPLSQEQQVFMNPFRVVGLIILLVGVILQPIGWMYSHWLTPISFLSILLVCSCCFVIDSWMVRARERHQGASRGARCQAIFMVIAVKCPAVDRHPGTRLTRQEVVAPTEEAVVTDRPVESSLQRSRVTTPNPALNLAPFGRWTALKRRRLALR